MANPPENEADKPQSAPLRFTLSTGAEKDASSSGSLKIGRVPPPSASASKPTGETPKAAAPLAHPDIEFDDAPTATTPAPSSIPPTHAIPKMVLTVEGVAAVVAITFTALLFKDLLPYL